MLDIALLSGVTGPAVDLNFLSGVMDPRVTFTRASAGWYFNSAGTLTQAGVDAPRFDYNPSTLASLGLWMEESRTNLLLNSATLSTQTVTGLTAVSYTLSFYGTGSVVMSGVFSGTLAGTGAAIRVSQTFVPSAGSLVLTVSGSVTSANLEVGLAATSPIITAGATVTRAADVASMALVTGPSYSLAAEASVDAVVAAGTNQFLAQLDDGTTQNRVVIYRQGSDGASATLFDAANVAIFTPMQAIIAQGATYKAAAAHADGISRVSTNGAAATNSTAAGIIAKSTTLRLGSSSTSVSQTNGHLRRVRYWKRALSAAEIQGVTL